jgi:hypothetical protein
MVEPQRQKWKSTLKTNICSPKSRTNCHNVTVGPTATFAHINCDSWPNVFLIHVIPARAASGVPSCGPPSVTTTVPQRWLGPRALCLVFKYNQFLGAKGSGGGEVNT